MCSSRKRQRLAVFLQRLWAEEKGEDIVEYGLILSLVSLAVIGAASQLGISIQAVWQEIGNTLAGAGFP